MFGDFRKFEDPKPPPKPQEKLPDTTEKEP